MLSYSSLIRPTPNDANLRTSGDPLGMIRTGNYDLNHFYLYKGSHGKINNRTNDPFNHIIKTGPGPLSTGGITPFPTLASKQNTGNQVSNNPVPVRNALISAPIHYNINRLVDVPLPPQINPIAITSP